MASTRLSGLMPSFCASGVPEYPAIISALQPPRRGAAVLAGPVEAQPVAGGIAEPGFAPKPALVHRRRVERDAFRFELGDARVQVDAFEIEMRAVRSTFRRAGMQ